jgi:hypothetical protein
VCVCARALWHTSPRYRALLIKSRDSFASLHCTEARPLVAGFLPRRKEFEPGPGHVGFVVDNVFNILNNGLFIRLKVFETPFYLQVAYIYSHNWCEDWMLWLGEGHSVVPFRSY